MIHATPVRLILVAAMALVGLGVLSGGALGQAASPVAGTPLGGAEAAGLSAADMAYLEAMTPIVTTVQDSLVRYVSLTSDPQPEKLDWLEKFAFELMRWRSAYQDARPSSPQVTTDTLQPWVYSRKPLIPPTLQSTTVTSPA